MIITCEQCNSRYLLASLLLGESGRKVRCGVCGHSWFQEAAEEELTRESADEITFADIMADHMDPIPEGVRPVPEGSGIPVLRQKKNPFKKEDIGGACAALLVFVLFSVVLFGGLVAFRESAMRAWPPVALVYELAGIAVSTPGDGLIFDQLRAVATPDQDKAYRLTVTGNIINLKQEEMILPKIQGVVDAQTWPIKLEKRKIAGEDTMPFTSIYNDLPDHADEVTIRFTLD